MQSPTVKQHGVDIVVALVPSGALEMTIVTCGVSGFAIHAIAWVTSAGDGPVADIFAQNSNVLVIINNLILFL